MGPSKLLKLVPVPSRDQARFIGMDIMWDYSVEMNAVLALTFHLLLLLLKLSMTETDPHQ